MQYVTIPLDFENLPGEAKASIVPICIERADRDGQEIAWGWFEAVEEFRSRCGGLRAAGWRTSGEFPNSLKPQFILFGTGTGLISEDGRTAGCSRRRNGTRETCRRVPGNSGVA